MTKRMRGMTAGGLLALAAMTPGGIGAQDAFQGGLEASLQQLRQLQQDFHRRWPEPDYRSQRYVEERLRYLEQRVVILEDAVFRGGGLRGGYGGRFSRSFTTQAEMTESWAWDAVMRAKRDVERQGCVTSEPMVERRGGSFYGSFTYDCAGR